MWWSLACDSSVSFPAVPVCLVDSGKESDFLQHFPHLCLEEELAMVNVDTAYSSCSRKAAACAGPSEGSRGFGHQNG